MAKTAFLLPQPEMCELAWPMIERSPEIDLMCLEYIQTHQAASRARELESRGCDLIVARGVQARIIRKSVTLPVVEVQATTQELGLLFLEFKQKFPENPRFGLVCFANMVGDTSRYNDLFGIDLKTYFVDNTEDLPDAVDRAKRDGCQMVIGGNIVCERAAEIGLPGRFFPSGVESLRIAVKTAARVCYAINQEKRNFAEMEIMLNAIFNGVMKVDRTGTITRINRMVPLLLEKEPEELLNHPVTQSLPDLNPKVLEDALERGRETYAVLLNISQKAVVLSVSPVIIDGNTEGAILTLQEGRRIAELDGELRAELYRRGYIAKYKFDDLSSQSRTFQELVKAAKRVARYQAPVFLTGEAGSGKQMIAQCIHNESLFRDNAFIQLDCSAWLPDTLDRMLFGDGSEKAEAGVTDLARDGTLYLSHVEHLNMETQYKIFRLIRGQLLRNGSNRPASASVRVIASSRVNLAAKVEQGSFRRDLYYALSTFHLELPPLRRRREDIPALVSHFLNEWQERYRRYVRLNQGAEKYMRDYDWPGNLNQLNSVCERIVLLAESHHVDEVFLKKQIEFMAPKMAQEKIVIVKDPKEVQIADLLRKYGGNREKVAQELGVSKTTLWRYMKKYGIEANYS